MNQQHGGERSHIRRSMDRPAHLLRRQLTVVALAAQAGVHCMALHMRHAGLEEEFHARVRSERTRRRKSKGGFAKRLSG